MTIWFGGGLGNQMFQYGLYRSAQYKGFEVQADLSAYDQMKMHNGFELGSVFNIKLDVSREGFRLYRKDLVSRVIRKVGFKEFGVERNIIREVESKYIPNLLRADHAGKYLFGYWQSERYFEDVASELMDAYSFPPLSNNSDRTAEEIAKTISVAVHVRRGDYLKSTMYADLCTTTYYREAMRTIREERENVTFFIFSDDLAWCRRHFSEDQSIQFVDGGDQAKAYEDMYLMSLCEHNIIANSSFSWWGAWLNRHEGKIVLAPDQWFHPASRYDASAIIPERWRIIRTSADR